ncbi:MAG: hypothetical protein K2X82_23405 [Gemmataceae bacterium]|nr:hypothetical protein [Gemmataceae bacterium]
MHRRTRLFVVVSVLLVVGGLGLWWASAERLPRRDGIRYDPIEDDPEVQPQLRAAEHEAADEWKDVPLEWRRGPGRMNRKKKILQEKYGIRWRTPAELNPDKAFD